MPVSLYKIVYGSQANASAGGANATTGTGGALLDAQGGVWSISGGKMIGSPNGGSNSYKNNVAVLPPSAPYALGAQKVRARFVANAAGGDNGTVARFSASGQFRFYYLVAVSGAWTVYRVDGAAATSLIAGGAYAGGAVADGTILECWLETDAGGLVTATISTVDPTTFALTQIATGSATDGTPLPNGSGGVDLNTNPISVTEFEFIDTVAVGTTAFTLTGPATLTGFVGAASGNFTVTPNGNYTGTITPSSGGGGGTFTPSSLSWTGDAAAKTFTYTPASAGAKSITASASPTLTAPAAVTYTVASYSRLTGTAGGQAYILYKPNSLSDGTAAPLFHFCHAYTNNAATPEDQIDAITTMIQTMTGAGYRIVSGRNHGDAWGNDAAQSDLTALDTAITGTYATTTRVLYAASMGGLLGTLAAINGAIPNLTAVALNCPVLNLPNTHANSSFTASIESAYGGSTAYNAAVAAHNPLGIVQADSTVTHNLPFRFYVSTDDAVIPPAQNATPFITALVAPEKAIVTATGGHTTVNLVTQPMMDDLLSFYLRNTALPTPAGTVATPTFSPVAGAVASGTVVTFSSTTSGATFYSTIDGSTPTTASTAGATRTVSAGQTIKVLAVKAGLTDSAVASATYTLLAPGTVATPTFSPVGGNYTGDRVITISCSTSAVSIYYTTDGSTPTTASTPYSSAITITTGTTVIKALAVKVSLTDSAVGSATYLITAASGGGGGTYPTADEIAQAILDTRVYPDSPTNQLTFRAFYQKQFDALFGRRTGYTAGSAVRRFFDPDDALSFRVDVDAETGVQTIDLDPES